MNVLDTLPKKLQAEARDLLTKIPYADTRADAAGLERGFPAWATKKKAVAGRRLEDDWDRSVTFYAFPEKHWKHLRTTNVVESPFAAVRLRRAAAKRVKKVGERDGDHLDDAPRRGAEFRRLNAPELLPAVAEGVVYIGGIREKRGNDQAPPDLPYPPIDKTSPPATRSTAG